MAYLLAENMSIAVVESLDGTVRGMGVVPDLLEGIGVDSKHANQRECIRKSTQHDISWFDVDTFELHLNWEYPCEALTVLNLLQNMHKHTEKSANGAIYSGTPKGYLEFKTRASTSGQFKRVWVTPTGVTNNWDGKPMQESFEWKVVGSKFSKKLSWLNVPTSSAALESEAVKNISEGLRTQLGTYMIGDASIEEKIEVSVAVKTFIEKMKVEKVTSSVNETHNSVLEIVGSKMPGEGLFEYGRK